MDDVKGKKTINIFLNHIIRAMFIRAESVSCFILLFVLHYSSLHRRKSLLVFASYCKQEFIKHDVVVFCSKYSAATSW